MHKKPGTDLYFHIECGERAAAIWFSYFWSHDIYSRHCPLGTRSGQWPRKQTFSALVLRGSIFHLHNCCHFHLPPPPHNRHEHNDRGWCWAINTWNRLDCILSLGNEPAYDPATTFTITPLQWLGMMTTMMANPTTDLVTDLIFKQCLFKIIST